MIAKTQFNVTSPVKVSGKERLSFSASLLDDHGRPIPEADIYIENYGLAGKTDREGNIRFLLDAVRFLPENIRLTLSFEGSDTYLPAGTTVTVAAESVIPATFLLPVIISATVILTFAANRSLLHKTDMSMANQQERLSRIRPSRETPLRISFPDIENSLPKVWGVGEILRVRIRYLETGGTQTSAEEGTVTLLVNGTEAGKGVLSRGYATFSHVFKEKGNYQLKSKLYDELLGSHVH